MLGKITTIRRLKGYSAAFWFSLTANAFFFFSFQGTFPVLPRFIAEIVLNRPPDDVADQVGLATTAIALVAVFTRIPAGQLTDRRGRRPFMLVGAACFAAAPLIYATSRSMRVLLLGRVVHGLGLGLFTTAFQALATELAPPGRRGEALGLAGASTSVAFMTAPLVGDWLASSWGYAVFFIVSAVAAMVAVVMVLLITTSSPRGTTAAAPLADVPLTNALNLREGRYARKEGHVGLRLALAQPGVRSGALTMAALGIPFGAFISFLPIYADAQQIVGVGAVFSIYAVTMLLAQPLAGLLGDRVGRRTVILPGLLITALGTVILSANGSLLVFSAAGIVLGVGGGLVRGGVDPLVQDGVPPTLRGTAAAVQYTSFDFWIGVGSYPIGILANAFGYATAFLIAGLVCVLGAGGVVVMLRQVASE
jgi:MFS family permease